MAKKMKRLLALMLALVILGSQLTMPALATEGAVMNATEAGALPLDGTALPLAPEGSATSQIPEGATVTDISDGNTTGTKTEYTDPNTGSNVTITVTQTTDPDTGATTEAGTKTETNSGTYDIGDGKTLDETTTDTQWESQTTTPIPGDDTPDEDGFTSQGGTDVTEIEGQESANDYRVTDEEGNPIHEGEAAAGEEITTNTTTETKEKTEEVSTDTSTTDNGYVEDKEASEEGEWSDPVTTTEKDAVRDAEINQEPGDVTLEMKQGSAKTRTDSETIYLDKAQLAEDNLDIPTPGAGDETTKNGFKSTTVNGNETTITEVEYIRENGVIIGYTVNKTVITTEVTRDDTDYTQGDTITDIDYDVDDNTGDSQEVVYLMPVKPEGGTTVNADGSTTVTTVEEITEEVLDADGNPVLDADGNPVTEVIGYRTVKNTTSADGLATSYEADEIYRTKITTTVDTTTTDVTTTDVTDLTKKRETTTSYARFFDAEGEELVIKDGKWVYKATMSTVKKGKNHGDKEFTPLTPTSVVLAGKSGVVNRTDSTVTPTNDKIGDGGEYLYTGVRGEGSVYQVLTSQNYNSPAHMFEMKVGDQKFYVYCVDFATTATPNFDYNIENVADANYYGEEESRHIQFIGMNGYWGVTGKDENGNAKNGSLAAVKAKLLAAKKAGHKALKNITEAQINALTHGEALTATQAAFWNYGNAGSTTIDNTQANKMITAVYQWLISGEADISDTTDIIDASEFATKASITVKDQATNADNTGKTATVNGTTHKVYNTDVSFTIDVAKSSLTGNMKITLKQNGKTVRTIDVATEDSNWLGKLTADSTEILFKDVELIEGVNFDISLTGDQELKEGVYIYTSEKAYCPDQGKTTTSQTFVGLAEGTQEVDLSVTMSFTVSEPEVQVKDPGKSSSQTKKDTLVEVKRDTETVVTTERTTSVETTVEKETKRSWFVEKFREWKYDPELTVYREDGGGTTILDEEVPLADAPKTGDLSGIWAAVSAVSLAGMAMLSVKRKED